MLKLKEIEKAVNRAFKDYGLKFTSGHESIQEPNELVTLIAVEVLREITVEPQPQAASRKKKLEEEHDA